MRAVRDSGYSSVMHALLTRHLGNVVYNDTYHTRKCNQDVENSKGSKWITAFGRFFYFALQKSKYALHT